MYGKNRERIVIYLLQAFWWTILESSCHYVVYAFDCRLWKLHLDVVMMNGLLYYEVKMILLDLTIFDLELVPNCLINIDLELYEIINLALVVITSGSLFYSIITVPVINKNSENLLDRVSRLYYPVLITETSQSRQHSKSESVSYYLTD
ncbi:hypothetical protein Tco_0077386 [Tanacetum coccineum]